MPQDMRRYRPRFRSGPGLRLEAAQWRALALLEPTFLFLRTDAFHHLTRASLQRSGLAEFRAREDYVLGRLTAAGMEVRDMVFRHRAEERDRQLWGSMSAASARE